MTNELLLNSVSAYLNLASPLSPPLCFIHPDLDKAMMFSISCTDLETLSVQYQLATLPSNADLDDPSQGRKEARI